MPLELAATKAGTAIGECHWRNMYRAPPNCKKNRRGREQFCENVSGLLEECDLRALDDNPRVPVLVNPHGRERPRYVTGFQARRLTVFSSFLSSAELLRSELQSPTSSSWKKPCCAVDDGCYRWPKLPN
jgi:hypothetical protein